MARIISKKGCLTGCSVVIVIGVAVIATTVFTVNRTYDRAVEAREALDESYGTRADFDPGAGPVVAAGRLEAFLEVRRSLTGNFEKMKGANEAMRGMERFDGVDDVPKKDILSQAVSSTWGVMSQMQHLGTFASDRNRALLDNGMGLGEYAWIYTLAYYGCLGEKPILGMGEDRPGSLPPTVRREVAEMMRRRADALVSRGAEADIVEAKLWRDEAKRLADDAFAVPFSGEAPETVSRCIEPRRPELAALFSRDSDALELMRIKEFGMGYEDR